MPALGKEGQVTVKMLLAACSGEGAKGDFASVLNEGEAACLPAG